MDRLPDEIISEVLVHARSGAGDTIEDKYVFPATPCQVSKRFRAVALSTHHLWTHVVLKGPPDQGFHERVGRSGTLPLVLKVVVKYCENGPCQQFLSQNLPRWLSLTFDDLDNSVLLLEPLLNGMPQLEELDLGDTIGDPWILYLPVTSALFPQLRAFRSSYEMCQLNNTTEDRLSGTVEDVVLKDVFFDYVEDCASLLHSHLPQNLRFLHLYMLSSDVALEHYAQEETGLRLPNLREIRIDEIDDARAFDLLGHLDVPVLKKLVLGFADKYGEGYKRTCVHVSGDSKNLEGWRSSWWSLRFATLTHLEIITSGSHPRLATLVQDCPSITHLVLDTTKFDKSMNDFVEELSMWSKLLPRLALFQVFGTSILTLQRVVDARPTLKYLKIHALDLGLTSGWDEAAFSDWEEAVESLESSVELHVSTVSGYGFYTIYQECYRTWEDEQNDNYIRCGAT